MKYHTSLGRGTRTNPTTVFAAAGRNGIAATLSHFRLQALRMAIVAAMVAVRALKIHDDGSEMQASGRAAFDSVGNLAGFARMLKMTELRNKALRDRQRPNLFISGKN